jgi:hypothetical protein
MMTGRLMAPLPSVSLTSRSSPGASHHLRLRTPLEVRVEVKIGIKGAARELVLETDLTPDAVAEAVRSAAADPNAVLELADSKGRRILVPSDKLAYVEIGEQEARRVGFGAM